nr:6919_t:CDS:2 [Entrophospora candida]CAG8535048.1 13214_t:CDS:2 [Entrophospora candida]
MFTQVIERVLNKNKNDCLVDLNSGVTAILKGYKRLKVKDASYPAIIKTDNDIDTVEGILMRGFSDKDFDKLDKFEDEDYDRINVDVYVAGEGRDSKEPIKAQTYIWIASNDLLEDKDWSPEYFKEYIRSWNEKDFEEL